MPGARRAHPGSDAVLDLGVGPMADDDFARETHAGVNEARLPVAMRGLVQVHEVHVDRVPGQVAIELGVKMDERLLKRVQPAYPHFRRRKRVHPEYEAGAVGIGVRIKAELGDFVRRRQQAFEFGLERELRRGRKGACDLLRMRRDQLERPRAVEMLGAANEPDLWVREIDHSRLSFLEWSELRATRSVGRTTVILVAHI